MSWEGIPEELKQKSDTCSENLIHQSPFSWEFLSPCQAAHELKVYFVFYNLRAMHLRNCNCHAFQRKILAFPIRQNQALFVFEVELDWMWSPLLSLSLTKAVPQKKCQWHNLEQCSEGSPGLEQLPVLCLHRAWVQQSASSLSPNLLFRVYSCTGKCYSWNTGLLGTCFQ